MLSRLRNIFRVEDLRNKVLYTVLIIAVFRFGSHIPVPFVDFDQVRQLEDTAKRGGVVGLLNLFSGGAVTNVAIFALGIMPYITSSIIMQLLAVVIPKIEEWQNEGQVGQKKITQTTRYLTVSLALIQSFGIIFALHNKSSSFFFANANQSVDVFPKFNSWRVLFVALTLTAGTAFVMWLGELITQRGIGNGMSILIFAAVVSRLPGQGALIWDEAGGKIKFFAIIAMAIGMIVGIVYVESGQRRIPVQFAKRQVGRRMYGGQNTYIPLKVNQSGVIPIIFASSILYFPVIIASFVKWDWFRNFVDDHLTGGAGLSRSNGGQAGTSWGYILIYTALIIFFAYFYTTISFNPTQQADAIRRQGGFIPGIRPGPPTESYLAKVLNRITLPGSLFLAAIALVPLLVFKFWNIANFPFGGTSLLITVGVALETMRQIDSQLMMRNYEGFLQ